MRVLVTRTLTALFLILSLQAHAHNVCESLLSGSEKLVFTGVNGRDVYNPTKPFAIEFHGKKVTVMAARVESRHSETDTQAMFFIEANGIWAPLIGAPVFDMQDPFFTFIDGELIFGGVETFQKLEGLGYHTVFYRGKSLEELKPKKPFLQGPKGMKDIRLVEISKGKIGLFTRPQGIIPGTTIDAGPGKIGFKIISRLEDLTADYITDTPLIDGQFFNGDWGGANEAQMLPNGHIGVLAHLARFDAQRNRHYYAVVFTLDPATGKVTPIEVILERGQLTKGLKGESKRLDLIDVVFSAGWILNGSTMTLYVGAGDAEVHVVEVKIPTHFSVGRSPN